MPEAISFGYKSFKEWKNNTASHKLYKTTESGVCRQVSCCFKEFLRLPAIDISKFTGYLTRAAWASKAKQVGLSLPETLKRDQWTNKTTFETFRNKPTVHNCVEILQSKLLCLDSFKHSLLYQLRFNGMKLPIFIRARSAWMEFRFHE